MDFIIKCFTTSNKDMTVAQALTVAVIVIVVIGSIGYLRKIHKK